MSSQQKFVGRTEELRFLQNRYASATAEHIVLYGRRRIGKTELILEFMKDKPSIYFLATGDSERNNLESMQALMADFLDDLTFRRTRVSDWVTLFELFKRFNTARRKVVICIDEFPYLIQLNQGIPSVFQKIWDTILKDEHIMLILNGSSVAMMEESVLSAKSPLYGRRSGQWNLKDLRLDEIPSFFPGYTTEQVLAVWSVLGGVPGYLNKFSSGDLWENIADNILSKGAFLYEEPEILLRDEFREPKNYKLLLSALATGHHTVGAICNHTGLDKSMISRYLDVLQNTHMVEGRLPVTANRTAKRRWYCITDTFFHFWFRFVYPHRVDLEAGRVSEVLGRIRERFPSYMGSIFEEICVALIRDRFFFTGFETVGKWWHKENEIDVVALDEQGLQMLVGECKWQDNVNAERVLPGLREKARYIDWHNTSRKERCVIFAKSFRSKPRLKDVSLIDLNDIKRVLGI